MSTVGDFFDFQNGYAFKSKDFLNQGKYKIIRIKELKDGLVKFFSDTVYIDDADCNIYKYMVEKGDVLFALTGDPVSKSNPLSWVGRVSYYEHDEPALLNQRVCKAIAKADISKEFLYYFFRQEKEFYSLASKATGSASQANISTKTIEQHNFQFFDRDTCNKIVGVLLSLDEKIELNNKVNKNLQEQAQTIYSNMFIQNVSDQWSERILSDVADITMGQSPKGDTYNEDGVGTVFFQGRGEFGFRFPTRRLFTTNPKRMAQSNDVLVSVRAPVGDLNVAYEPCCIGRGLGAIRSKDNHQSFVLYTVFSLREKLDIFNGEGTVFGSINREALNSMPITIPTKEEMDRFEQIVAPMDAAIRNNYEEICRLEGIRDSLLPRLMSGELDVSNLDL